MLAQPAIARAAASLGPWRDEIALAALALGGALLYGGALLLGLKLLGVRLARA